METIGQNVLWTLDRSGRPIARSNLQIRKAPGIKVKNYRELAHHVAELQFRNRDFVLVFRGQSKDHRNKAGNTSLRPGIFRARDATGMVPFREIRTRFERLAVCDQRVATMAHTIYQEPELTERLRRQRILKWTPSRGPVWSVC
jgi:hypothetical protein